MSNAVWQLQSHLFGLSYCKANRVGERLKWRCFSETRSRFPLPFAKVHKGRTQLVINRIGVPPHRHSPQLQITPAGAFQPLCLTIIYGENEWMMVGDVKGEQSGL